MARTRRSGGAHGVRQHLLVIPSVLCSAQAAKVIAEGIPGAVAIEHQHGRSQLGGDARLTEQILTGLGAHPNVAGTLVVGLGCETVQGLSLYRAIEGRGQRAAFVGIQQAGGTLAAIRAGREALVRLRDAAAADPEVPITPDTLCVGVEAAWLSLPQPQAAVFAEVIRRLLAAGAIIVQAVPQSRAGAPVGSPTAIVPPSLAPLAPRATPYAHSVARSTAVADTASAHLLLMPAPETRIAQKTGLAAAGAHIVLSALVEGLPAGCPVAPVVHVGIAPSARAFVADVEVMLDVEPAAAAAPVIVRALEDACREETVAEVLGTFEMAIHRIAPTM